jgi:hypothetical protein
LEVGDERRSGSAQSLPGFSAEPSTHAGRVALVYKWGREDVTAAPMK